MAKAGKTTQKAAINGNRSSARGGNGSKGIAKVFQTYRHTGVEFVDRVVALAQRVYSGEISPEVARVGKHYLIEESNRIRLVHQIHRDTKKGPPKGLIR